MAGKTILITGVSSGFGRLAVPLLLRRGHTILAGIRGGEARLRALYGADHADAIAGGRLVAVDLHMDRPESFAAVRQRIDADHGGRLDVLVNNAGYGLLAPVEDMGEAEIRKQMEVNFFGPTLLATALLGPLRAARGRILNVTSVAGLMSFPYYGVYSASKSALECVTDAWRTELAPFGVQVGLVEPGGYRTEFTATALSRAAGQAPEGSLYAARTREFAAFLGDAERKAAGDPGVVARRIARLCDVRRVPMRTLCGPDAWGLSLLRRILPFGWRAWIVDLVFRRVIFRGAF